jgi:hypothetical protein
MGEEEEEEKIIEKNYNTVKIKTKFRLQFILKVKNFRNT